MTNPYLPQRPLARADDFTEAVYDAESERLAVAREHDLESYSETIRVTDRAQGLLGLWSDLYNAPFTGVTHDGSVEPNLFRVADEGFEVEAAVAAADALLDGLSEAERAQVSHAIDGPEWRGWYNPEWLVNHAGLRLDAASDQTHEQLLKLMRACLSEAGFTKVQQTRSANLYIGELYDLRHILNEWSYHLLVYGTPSTEEPWGWSMYGHHLALNVFILGRQIVISPTFLGVEPRIISRPDGGESFEMFSPEAEDGLALLRSLRPELRDEAIVYAQMRDPAMPDGRWHFADERHLAGAFQDNRVIGYEGVSGSMLDREQHALILRIAEHFLAALPDGPRAARLNQIEEHLADTWFSWIGGHGDDDPFYYRIQSPVVLFELDHHCGMWLTNTEPAKYHVHAIVRTPNAGDYGTELLRQHRRLSTSAAGSPSVHSGHGIGR